MTNPAETAMAAITEHMDPSTGMYPSDWACRVCGKDGARGKITLWVGLHPDIGCVNIDAGRERLEEEGYEVTDWGAA